MVGWVYVGGVSAEEGREADASRWVDEMAKTDPAPVSNVILSEDNCRITPCRFG